VYSSCQLRSFEFSLATKEGSLIVERDFNKVKLQDKRHQKSCLSELYHLSKLYHQSLCHISCHRERQYLQPATHRVWQRHRQDPITVNKIPGLTRSSDAK